MIENPGILWTIGAFILVLGPLVFVHEFGHYIVARWCGVKSDIFSIGFGREVAGFTDKHGTRWKFGWLPLGGYVQFAGDMNPVSQPGDIEPDAPAAERAHMFQYQPIWKRAAIVFAGPAINFIFAFLILMGFGLVYGQSVTPPVVGQVVEGSAAEQAGLKAGDRIVSANGDRITVFQDIVSSVALQVREPVKLVIERDGASRELIVTTRELIEKDRFGNEFRRGFIGVSPGKPQWADVSLLEAPGYAWRQTVVILDTMVEGLKQIITGKRTIKDLGGPLKIAKQSGESAAIGVEAFIFLIALISINLGFINLLPLPMLDGGHLLFYAIEAVRRKPANPKVQEWAFRFGFAAVATLFLVVTFNDLESFGVWKRIVGLIG